MKRLIHFLGLLCLLMLATLMVTAARTSWSVHQGNGRLQNAVFPAFPAPEKQQRLLIVSPHPDDETLGCGGLIRRATKAGIPVTVVIVTNGDAFPWAVQRAFRKLRPTSADYVRFGKLRQVETLKAMHKLGVPARDVVFLGYPDRGLESLWMSNWSADRPYAAVRTRRTSNPYPRTYHPNAPYTGESLTEDLTHILWAVKPTDLFFTHPNDDHPDHAYLSCFLLAALRRADTGGSPTEDAASRFAEFQPALSGVRLHTFLVHRGNWPTPQGFDTKDRLPPPAALARLDTQWRTLSLTENEIAAKTAAIRSYASQMRVRPGARFLLSFARQNELFGDYRFILTARSMQCGPVFSSPWFLTFDPTDDKFQRDLEPGADLEEVGVRRVGDALVVRVMARGNLSRWVRYRINLHRLDVTGGTEAASLRFIVSPRKKTGASGATFAWEPDALEATVPLAALRHPSELMVNAETIVGGMVVDRSAWRGVDLRPSNAVSGSRMN